VALRTIVFLGVLMIMIVIVTNRLMDMTLSHLPWIGCKGAPEGHLVIVIVTELGKLGWFSRYVMMINYRFMISVTVGLLILTIDVQFIHLWF